ncbi:cyclase family protein [Pseudonocardia kujensis]|uniref:cyclase family protein n=1 Tax=Pseudonocardia kujensis TaxID=1128675 RepID=UPI001E53DAAD|nr:cyclase family protein [Pseudonocardia kujensis]MCE0764073.1 cyclase family protein [Pseudonocardia kujensis]
MNPDVVEIFGKRVALLDLSCVLSNDTRDFEPLRHDIEYIDHKASAENPRQPVDPAWWPDGNASAIEKVSLFTHSGTHVDAPYHYGPVSGGLPAKTIDQVPLTWCCGPGVLLDFRHLDEQASITDANVAEACCAVGHEPGPGDVVLIHTGAARRFDEPGYDQFHPGMRRSATKWLVERGVNLIAIDAWGFDRPFSVMVDEARKGNPEQLWEAHLYGREREYSHIEKAANFERLPKATGFFVSAFPYKIAGASGSWTRLVAYVPEEDF